MKKINILLILLIPGLCVTTFQSCEPYVDENDTNSCYDCDGCKEVCDCYDTSEGDYYCDCFWDCGCDDNTEGRRAYKPNIYIYPEENIELSVSISFPQGGDIIESIPEYGNGWNVYVDTNGIIDNAYTFLFYESIQPDIWQRYSGWTIKQTDMECFFSENLEAYGFRGQEIDDFIEYWIPRLNDYEYYCIFPQTSELIKTVINIEFSNQPDNLLRLFYVIEGYYDLPMKELDEPIIDTRFNRDGYFVVEWGVVLD
ncbi:MAG: hypothetical protein JXB49_21845 [Bacteroidales bacterium]|nr:hypothetical protein [Bacteroidales bacterium]